MPWSRALGGERYGIRREAPNAGICALFSSPSLAVWSGAICAKGVA
jgi:hypothetical protein